MSIEASGSCSSADCMTIPEDSDSSDSGRHADISDSNSCSDALLHPNDSDSSVGPQTCSTPKRSAVFRPSSVSSDSAVSQSSSSPTQKTSTTARSGRAAGSKRKWSDQEVAAVESKLGRHIKLGTSPGKDECEECIRSHPDALRNRDWRAVKFFVRNKIVSLNRKKC